MKSALCALATGLLIACPLAAQQIDPSPNAITWVVIDLPPFSIVDGPLAGAGITQKIVGLFKQRLPQFTHSDLNAPIGRRETLAERGDHVCSASVIRTPERERRWLFSKDIFPFLPPRLFIQDGIDLQGMTQVSPTEINRFERIAVENYRSQGPVIDALIASITDDHKTLVPSINTAIAMFRSQRVEAFFGFSHEVAYLTRDYGDIPYRSLPIRGATPIAGGLACANSDWGRAVIAQIDALVDDETIRKASDFYLEWIDGQGRTEYKIALADFLALRGAVPSR